MQTIDLFTEIGSLFPNGESVQILTALRQDPIVWSSLQREEFLQAALVEAGSHSSWWSPGRLAMLALDEAWPEAHYAEPLTALSATLQEKALRAYQVAQRTAAVPGSLAEAGLLALALRERRRLTGTWSGLLQELLPRSGLAEALSPVWRTPLACLYGLIPDPEQMMRELAPKTVLRVPLNWVAHILVAQPLGSEEQARVLTHFLESLSAAVQLGLLRSLSLRGFENLARTVASSLVAGHPAFTNLRSLSDLDEPDLANLTARALSLHQMGSFYQLGGDRDQARSLLESAKAALEYWLAGLNLQRLSLVNVDLSSSCTLWDDAWFLRMAESDSGLKNELGMALIGHPSASSVLDQVSGQDDNAFALIHQARGLFGDEPAVARDLARQGARKLTVEIHRLGMPFNAGYLFSWKPGEVVSILLDLGLLEEALELVEACLAARPADVHLLDQAGHILERLGKIERAVQTARNVVVLAPQEPAWRRTLALRWGMFGKWEEAYEEWQKVISLTDSSSLEDRLACAQAAYQAGRVAEAVCQSESILEEDPSNGVALSLLGQALISQGETQKALGILVRATLLVPECLPAWLALAKVQHETGESQRAIETLRAAVTAVPGAPEGHLALGQACLSAGLLAESLPHLKKAFSLAPQNGPAALAYGRVLRQLGHMGEARQVLERIRPAWKQQPELAYEYALVLLAQSDADDALPILEAALHDGLPLLEAYLLYAKILLGEFRAVNAPWDEEVAMKRMQQADQALRKILEMEPDSLEARFLMADILREKGELEEALELYRALAELPAATTPELRWRAQWGLGRTAMRLGQTDLALVALREAVQAKPDSLLLQHGLAEASARVGLADAALDAANAALQLAPDHVENLAWYASLAGQLGECRLAVDALERAAQIEPCRADLLIRLAECQMSLGDLAAVCQTLETVFELENVGSSELRQAGQISMRMEDPAEALKWFNRALAGDPAAPPDLLFEVAELHERMGNLDAALELSHRALDEHPNNLRVYLFQSDLLARLDRPEAALALLERALRMAQVEQEKGLQVGAFLGEIHICFMRLMLAKDDLAAALYHAEKALDLDPNRADLAYQAADLALALLQDERAARILAQFMLPDTTPFGLFAQPGGPGTDLVCLQIEVALDNGQIDRASAWVESGIANGLESARLRAARARVLVRKGDWPSAQQDYEAAVKSLRERIPDGAQQRPLWLAQAALEVQNWKDCLAMFEDYAQNRPGEARAQLALARALVLVAEQQRFCAEVDCRIHAPGLHVVDETHEIKFTEAIQAAARLATTNDITRWQVRGQAVFTPSVQTARALAAMLANGEDAAALVAALRQLNNRTAATQMAHNYSQDVSVLAQLALCYQSENVQEGFEIAEQVAQAKPQDPLAQAVLARLARQSGDLMKALQAYSAALQIWPDEPAWQDALGDLYLQSGQLSQGLAHRKQAAALDPNHALYAYKLGQASLAQEDARQAIDHLEKATSLNSRLTEAWLALATAYRMVGRLSQALEAARQASELDPGSAAGLLIAGEAALAMDRIDLALEFGQGAVRREPESPAAFLFLSNVWTLQGRFTDGLAVLEQSSPVVKASYPVALDRARLIHKVHGPKRALEALEKLVKDHSEEPGLLGYLASIQAECGEAKQAERYGFKALRLNPNQPELALMLGRLQRKSGQLDQAVYLLGETIRLAPDCLEAYLELASVFQERREYSQALEIYRQAMQIVPNDYQAFYQSGLILRDSKDYAGAEAMLRRAANIAPDNLIIRRQLVAVIALNLVHSKQEVTV